MEQNKMNSKFHIVVTDVATGEPVADWVESTAVVIASNINEVAEGTKASSRVFISGEPFRIAQLIEGDDDLYKCALLAQLINAMKSAEKEDAE